MGGEPRCPELSKLQAVCNFFIAADPDFLQQLRTPEVTVRNFRDTITNPATQTHAIVRH